jgi:hypothetical protein
MPTLTRGPLPARVYWVRRAMVLGFAFLLVVGIARLLGDGSDGSSGPDDTAAQVAAATTPSGTDTSGPPTFSEPTRRPGLHQSRTRTPLAAPTGPCSGEDIAVTPEVTGAVAGRDVKVVLQLRTLSSPACTWQVSPRNLAVKITSGPDDIWSSRDCPRSIPARQVTVRTAATTKVAMIWKQAKRSDSEDCARFTDWAMPGWYHVSAAALGGEPSDVQFELTTPTAATVTRTVQPSNSPSGRPVTPSGKPSGGASGKASGKAPGSASGSASGAVEPD